MYPKRELSKIGMNRGIGIDQDLLGGQTVSAVAGNGVAMIEVTMFAGIEGDLVIVVEGG